MEESTVNITNSVIFRNGIAGYFSSLNELIIDNCTLFKNNFALELVGLGNVTVKDSMQQQ